MEKYSTQHIESFLEGRLNEQEKEQIIAAAQNDLDLQEKIYFQRIVVDRVRRNAMANEIEQAHLRYINTSGNGWIKGGIFIGIITLVTIVSVLLMYEKNNAHKEISLPETKSDTVSKASPVTFEKIEVPANTYSFEASQGLNIKDPRSGARIVIKPNSLTDKRGNLISGQVNLSYREYRSQADIALSNIPLTYRDLNFNSAGMFEIRAFQNSDTLYIKSGSHASITFPMTKEEKGIGFYQLDQTTKEWRKLKSLDKKTVVEDIPVERPITEEISGSVLDISRPAHFRTLTEIDPDVFNKFNLPPDKTFEESLSSMVSDSIAPNPKLVFSVAKLIMTPIELQMSQEEWEAYIKNNTEIEERINSHLDSLKRYGAKSNRYIQKLANINNNNLLKIQELEYRKQVAKQDSLNKLLLTQGRLDKGHYIDPKIRELKISGFGIFNCDQVYRMKKPIVILGQFYDKDQKPIEKNTYLSVIDKKINGAFSFDPAKFTISSSSETVLLLFTMDNQIFYLDPKILKQLEIKSSGKQKFYMENITSKVNSSQDLQKIIEGKM